MKNKSGTPLTTKQVKALPSGAKVVRKGKVKDYVCTVVQYGKHKKLFYEDKFSSMKRWYVIRDEDEYEAL